MNHVMKDIPQPKSSFAPTGYARTWLSIIIGIALYSVVSGDWAQFLVGAYWTGWALLVRFTASALAKS